MTISAARRARRYAQAKAARRVEQLRGGIYFECDVKDF
jgi:hypothetical protein